MSPSIESNRQQHPQLRQQQRRRKRVVFDKLIVADIVCNYTQEEIESYWYQEEEYDRMAKRDRTIARKISRGDCDKNFCQLGLLTEDSRKERRERIYRARLDVFEEQQLQWEDGSGMYNSDDMAAVCYEHSRHSLLLAHERGLSLTLQLKKRALAKNEKTYKKLGQVQQHQCVAKSSSQKSSPMSLDSCQKSPVGVIVSPTVSPSKISKFIRISMNDRNDLALPRQ